MALTYLTDALSLEYISRNITLIVGTVLLAICLHGFYVILSTFFNNRRCFNKLKDIPTTPELEVFDGSWRNIESMKQESKTGPVMRQQVGLLNSEPLINATHPDTAKTILAHVDKKTNYNWQLLLPWLGEGLLTSKGEKWSRNRRLLTPAFHFGVLKQYVPVFQEKMEVVLEKWASMSEKNLSIEVANDIHEMALKALLKCAFGGGSTLTDQEEAVTIAAVHEIGRLYMLRFTKWLHYLDITYYMSANGRAFKRAVNTCRNICSRLIKERRKIQEEGGVEVKRYMDFLDIILAAKDSDGKMLTDDELLDEANTFLFAGHDTTSSAIPFLLYNLAKYPEHQEKCREEIERVMEDRRDITWDDISKFEYLRMCVKESLRITPAVAGINRKADEPITLPNGKVLPKETSVGMNILAIHHDAKFWENPEVFDPMRFHPSNADKRHPYAYVPFSAGPRVCIGQNFALTEIKVTVASTLRRFRLRLDPDHPLEMCLAFLLSAKDGMWFKMEEI